MISVTSLKKILGGRVLFENLTFHVSDGETVAIAGENGTGKSTLLKILAGVISQDEGDINTPKGTTIGYLPQHIEFDSKNGLYEEVSSVFEDIKKLHNEMRELEEQFSMPEYDEEKYQKLLDRYGDIQDELIRRDAFEIDGKVAEVLRGLGFKKRDWEKSVNQFSGGWKMKIYLAKLLLKRPNLLLLDEPTNHLDIDARNWLEEFLSSYPYSVIFISHDRYFVDTTAKRIYEIFNKKLEVYHCSFSKYLEEREERIDKIYMAKKKQDDEIARMQSFIDKFRAQVAKAQLVQSRIRAIEKMEKIDVPPRRKKIRFNFPPAPSCGSTIVEVRGLSKSFGENVVFKDLEFTIVKGEKVVLLGVNGAGKTTLLRIITEHLKPDSGEVKIGHNVIVDYFEQEQTHNLDNSLTVLQEMNKNAPFDMVPKIRSLLGLFLFSGDDVNKSVGVLSGGERARLALAKMLLRPSNLLILDEPTNHLDILAKEVLMEAIQSYGGTVIFVSHDRYFVSNTASRVIELHDQTMRDFPGTYEEYYIFKKRMQLDEGEDDVR
jgi:ATP-binding cassette subfamily F protein 3